MSSDVEMPHPSTIRRVGKPGRSGPPGNSNAAKYHLHTVERDVRALVTRAMDRRTDEARYVSAVRGNLLADLAGADNLSKQELMLVDEVAFLSLQLAHINTSRPAADASEQARRSSGGSRRTDDS
jgi:hypothetical protein